VRVKLCVERAIVSARPTVSVVDRVKDWALRAIVSDRPTLSVVVRETLRLAPTGASWTK
jgi:hypothetical protein